MKPDCEHEAETHCIHSSERRSFRSCRRRHDWAFREHFLSDVTPKPLEVGIAFHSAMEAMYEPTRWDTTTDEEKLKLGIKVFVDLCHVQQQKFLKATGQSRIAESEVFGDDYDERIKLGIGMLTHYIREVHPIADQWFKPVAVEVPFSAPLLVPDHPRSIRMGLTPGEQLTCSSSPACGQTHPNPAPITLNGRVDAILEDLNYGGYYVADWKTAASLIINGEFLQLDDQITSYCAALQKLFNIDVRGFMYAEFKKAYPEPPATLTRLTQGRMLSVKKDQSTTYAIAKETMESIDPAGLEAGFYDEYLAMLQGNDAPKFHQRFPIIQSNKKLANVLDNISMEAMEITDPDLFRYPSPSKNNCSGCMYKAPCLGMFNGEDYRYTLNSSFKKKG